MLWISEDAFPFGTSRAFRPGESIHHETLANYLDFYDLNQLVQTFLQQPREESCCRMHANSHIHIMFVVLGVVIQTYSTFILVLPTCACSI